MKYHNRILAAILLILVTGCSVNRHTAEQTGAALAAYEAGDYTNSLVAAKQIIAKKEGKGKSAEADVYLIAGKSAYKLDAYEQSRDWLDKALNLGLSDEQSLFFQADNYRRIDNLSREITLLEEYIQTYSGGSYIPVVRTRLFQTCLESENHDLALELWDLLDPNSRMELENLEIYLSINQVLENTLVCDSIARLILDIDQDHESSLYWFASKYYWKAENIYQAEMKAYEEIKTRKQYARLVKAFETVTLDFKRSLDYYTRLYDLFPKPEYAKYLGNIYARLSDEKNAKYYHDRAI